MAGLRRDFDTVNEILCAMLDEAQERLDRIWPLLRLLDRVGCRTDEAVLHFSILHARSAAWDVAATLVRLQPEDAERELARVDEWTAVLARLIQAPGVSGSAIALMIRVTELRGVARVLDALA